MTNTKEIANENILDTRNIIERFEYLEEELLYRFNEQQEYEGTGSGTEEDTIATTDTDSSAFQEWLAQAREDDYEAQEYNELLSLLDELKGQGGDEQWKGYWYPATLIREDYFIDYTKDLVEDCYSFPMELPLWVEIDWKKTAENTVSDYSIVEFKGSTYYFR